MAMSIGRSLAAKPPIPVAGETEATRRLRDVYAFERIEEVIRGIVEDALDPTRSGETPWRDDEQVASRLREMIRTIAEATDGELADRLTIVIGSATPSSDRRSVWTLGFTDHS